LITIIFLLVYLLSIKPLLKKITEKSRNKNEESLVGYDEHELVHLAIKAG